MAKSEKATIDTRTQRQFRPNWQHKCENCGCTPTVPLSGLCGPCHFGTAQAVAGGWWDEGTDDFDPECEW